MLVMYGAVALSLSEMASRYPTAGGQYHWTALLAPDKWKRGLVTHLQLWKRLLTPDTVILLWLYQRNWSCRYDG